MSADGKVRITCKCGRRYKFGVTSLGKRFACANCGAEITVDEMRTSESVRQDTLRSTERKWWHFAINPKAAVLGAAGGAFVGIFISQYAPLWETRIGMFSNLPWSPKRMAIMPMHCVLFAVMGVAVSIGIAVALPKLLPSKAEEEGEEKPARARS